MSLRFGAQLSSSLCYPLLPFPFCSVTTAAIQRRCHLGCFLPLLSLPSLCQTTRIRSSNCNMCQTALNLEPRPPLSVRPLPVSGVSTDQSDLSSSKRRERRALAVAAAAVAIEVITEGWNCRLWNRALPGRARWKRRRGSRSGKSKHRIIHRSVRPNSGETEAPKKRSPYNLPCGETSISLARSVRHRVISRR